MRKLISGGLFMLLAGCAGGGWGGATPSAPAGHHDVWVASESADQIARIRFDGVAAAVVERRDVGMMPTEIDGPHGVALSPDGRFVYVTIAHGLPAGSLWKIDTRTMDVVGRTNLGQFPATVDVTPDGEFAFVSNFNLHGDPLPSSISKVHLGTMAEVARTETCVMPHGSRINPQGTRHYSVCMMDEVLVEIDAGTGEVARLFSLARGAEGPLDTLPSPGAHGHDRDGAMGDTCAPTWAEPGPDGSRVYVTCPQSGEVLEIDAGEWRVLRRIPTGDVPYNVAITPDQRYLLVTLRNRTDPALEIFDLRTGRMAGRVPTTTVLAHGVVVTPDSRFALVTVEGVGAEPGKVEVIDLRSLRRVADVAVGQQAGGIALVPE
jgi:YVTN family beta-propeller protein